MANLSHRRDPNFSESQTLISRTVPVTHDMPNQERQTCGNTSELPPNDPQNQQSPSTTGITVAQDAVQASLLVNMMSPVTSLMNKVLAKDEKDDKSKKTLDQFSADRNSDKEIVSSTSNTNSSYGIHPEFLKNVDYVSESVREKIVGGKYVNLTTLLIPESEK